VYLTEWNRATFISGDLAANEQVSADFLRLSLLDVDAWNRMPGNHNIRAMGWFVNDSDGGWQEYSLKWWQSQGNPEGHPGDLWTALMAGAELPAGLSGTRPITDYNSDGVVNSGDWKAWQANFGQTGTNYADGNRDGVVNALDYIRWRKSLSTAGGGASLPSVPEPGVGTLALIALAIARGRRKRRGNARSSSEIRISRRG
jgi:hypothetical protein